jgi:hypothetical protein
MSHIGFGRVSPFIFVRVYKEMSERKTIQINPELFKISKNTTRKKTPKVPKIELKSELKTQKQKTLRKNVLKMIREKQQDAYRELFDKKRAPEKLASSVGAAATFDKDFDSSLQFFSSLADKVKSETTTPPNITLRQYPPLEAPMGPIPSFIPTADMTTPTMIHTLPVVDTAPISLAPFPTDTMTPLRYIPGPAPLYGCLKNGSLPTYRTRKNMAQATPYYGGDRQSLAGLWMSSSLLLVATVMIGDVLPKFFAAYYPSAVLLVSLRLLDPLRSVLDPVVTLADRTTDALIGKMVSKRVKSRTPITRDEFETLVEMRE